MSKNLMETSLGGENTQYESIQEFTKPHPKFSDSQNTTNTEDGINKEEANSVGITPAEKIRYGQALQEGGMGGKTAGGLDSNTSTSDTGGREVEGEGSGNNRARAVQGYGKGDGVGG